MADPTADATASLFEGEDWIARDRSVADAFDLLDRLAAEAAYDDTEDLEDLEERIAAVRRLGGSLPRIVEVALSDLTDGGRDTRHDDAADRALQTARALIDAADAALPAGLDAMQEQLERIETLAGRTKYFLKGVQG